MINDGVVTLRAMEPEDAEAMYAWENDTSLWCVGDNTTPFSRSQLKAFIATADLDIYSSKQIRLIIEVGGVAVGTADLFDFNPPNLRAGIGILIYDKHHRSQGYATRALRLLCRFAFDTLGLKQLYAHATVDNLASIKMCHNAGFTDSGLLRQWSHGQDTLIMQLTHKQ